MKKPRRLNAAELDALIEEITTDSSGEDGDLWAFRQHFEDNVRVPCDAALAGEPVTVLRFDYGGNRRRGLTARVARADGSKHIIAAADLTAPPASAADSCLAAYRKWMGLRPYPPAASNLSKPKQPAIAAGAVELAVLSLSQKSARCRLLDGGSRITLRATRLWELVPGHIATVMPFKQWNYAGHPYLSGTIAGVRIDVSALGMQPLALRPHGVWDPREHEWGERNEPSEDWEIEIATRGPRPAYEMEQVLPGMDSDGFDDPIIDANDRKEAGDFSGAYDILMDLCGADLRCLDAHAHLGNLSFSTRPQDAIRHYEVGFRIGEWVLGEGFDGVLPWNAIDNRPFLRCMHGYGLCLWRLYRFSEAQRIFERMLWLNPSDNQGIRFLTGEVRARKPWRDGDQ